MSQVGQKISTLQNPIIKDIGYTKLFELNRDARAAVIINVGGAGSSKCLKKGTEVVMLSGNLKRVEDIRIGDQLMGIDSKPRKVLELHSGKEALFTIVQSKALPYTVTSDHLLCLSRSVDARKPQGGLTKGGTQRRPNGRYPSWGDKPFLSVSAYTQQTRRFKRNFFGYRVAIEFPEKSLPFDPYLLGVWLGDGDSNRIGFTNQDEEILQYLQQVSDKYALHYNKIEKKNKTFQVRLTKGNIGGLSQCKNPLLNLFRNLDLINNKHIPDLFLYNSRYNRLLLLAGLLDTDGCLCSNGFTITQVNKKLAEQIYYLAASLGFRTSFKSRIATIKDRGFSEEVWSVSIYGRTEEIPLRVKHKQAKHTARQINPLINKIKEIIPEGEGEYYGFSLDGDGLFLLKDFTVVHNSHSIAQLFVYKLITEENKFFGISRKTFPALRMTSMAMMIQLLKDYGVYDERKHNKTYNTYEYKTNQFQWFSLDEAEKIKSANFNYEWLEEANEFTYEDYMMLRLRLRAPIKPGEINQMFISLNPSDSTSWVARLCGDEGSGFHTKVVD